MKSTLALRTVFLLGISSLVSGGAPVSNVQVTLRGKKYEVSDVSTVEELQEKLKVESGVDVKQQGRLLFGGKRLSSSDILSDVGVENGAQLNLVPGKAKSAKSSAGSAGAAVGASSASADAAPPNGDFMQDLLRQSGVDPAQMDELMKNLPEDGKMPSMQESLEMMQGMMNSPILQEYMSDPEKLEQSRQMILQNPMLKSMMAGMPGMEEILNNPEAWREAMQAAANMYKNMDPNDLMKAMEGMGGSDGPGGLFDGMDGDSATTAALDELSEGDE